MTYHALFLIPIATLFDMWHRSLPSGLALQSYQSLQRQPQPHRKNKHKKSVGTAIVAGGILAGSGAFCDDLPWSSDDNSDDFISDYNPEDNPAMSFHEPSFTEDMLDPSKSYLPYNIYHEDNFWHSRHYQYRYRN